MEVQSISQPLLSLVQPRILLRPSDFQCVCCYPGIWHSGLFWWKGEDFRGGIPGPNTGGSSDLLL